MLKQTPQPIQVQVLQIKAQRTNQKMFLSVTEVSREASSTVTSLIIRKTRKVLMIQTLLQTLLIIQITDHELSTMVQLKIPMTVKKVRLKASARKNILIILNLYRTRQPKIKKPMRQTQ